MSSELDNVNVFNALMPGINITLRSYLFQEGVGESLNPELEGSEVGRLIQALHLLRHERLMDRLTLGIRSIHCGAQMHAVQRERH